jgi:predicted SAM-dependent methyltransferase
MASIQVKPTNPSPAARGPDRPTARIELVIALERLAGRLHRWGRIKPAAAPVKVNLGSGLFVARGWINIDGSLKALLARSPAFVLHAIHPWFANSGATREQFITLLRGNRFVHHDLKYGIPLPDSSADFVFSSHMLHHLYRDQAARMLAETMRVLKPGGIMRLVVPDLEYIMALYQRGNREQALSYFFYPSLRSDLFTRRYQYDFTLLKALLASAGFREVHRCAYRQGATPDLDVLDRLPEESLYVEAQRPFS